MDQVEQKAISSVGSRLDRPHIPKEGLPAEVKLLLYGSDTASQHHITTNEGDDKHMDAMRAERSAAEAAEQNFGQQSPLQSILPSQGIQQQRTLSHQNMSSHHQMHRTASNMSTQSASPFMCSGPITPPPKSNPAAQQYLSSNESAAAYMAAMHASSTRPRARTAMSAMNINNGLSTVAESKILDPETYFANLESLHDAANANIYIYSTTMPAGQLRLADMPSHQWHPSSGSICESMTTGTTLETLSSRDASSLFDRVRQLYLRILLLFKHSEADFKTEIQYTSLERSYSRLMLWNDAFQSICDNLQGDVPLDFTGASTRYLRDIILTLVDRFLHLVSNESATKAETVESLDSYVHDAKSLIPSAGADGDDESDCSSNFDYDSYTEVAEDLMTDTTCLVGLNSLISRPSLESLQSGATVKHSELYQTYCDRIRNRFPVGNECLISRLGKANHNRYLRCIRRRDEVKEGSGETSIAGHLGNHLEEIALESLPHPYTSEHCEALDSDPSSLLGCRYAMTSSSQNSPTDEDLNGVGSSLYSSSYGHAAKDMPVAQAMSRSASNASAVSNKSASSLRFRAKETLHRQNRNIAALKPKPATEQKATDGHSGKKDGKAAITKAKYVRPRQPKVFCEKCSDHPEGFRGEHELRRHRDTKHPEHGMVRKWVCVDPATRNLPFGVAVINPLDKCKACKAGKKYGAYYNAAVHLRRTHFKEKPSRAKKGGDLKGDDDKRGGKGGGDWPPMAELKNWMREIWVNKDDSKVDSDEEDDNEVDPSNADMEIDLDNNMNPMSVEYPMAQHTPGLVSEITFPNMYPAQLNMNHGMVPLYNSQQIISAGFTEYPGSYPWNGQMQNYGSVIASSDTTTPNIISRSDNSTHDDITPNLVK
ncbi:hypothetical protein G7054_g1049 [Neopestalotiopsis clavispora]|nr:hypothetical protein G7054_g1049 [Neopestalotiopsis clavispora]